MVFGNYVLAMEEAQEKEKKILSPFQFFFPEAEEELASVKPQRSAEYSVDTENTAGKILGVDGVEVGEKAEYLRDLRQDCVREYESWNRYFGSIRNLLDYQMIDESGKVILNHAQGGFIPNNEDYVFQAVLHYDDQGRMDISSVKGENTSYLLNVLQDFGDSDPMEDHYEDEYFTDGRFLLSNPKNVTFAYGMSAEQITSLTDEKAMSGMHMKIPEVSPGFLSDWCVQWQCLRFCFPVLM